MDSKYLIHQPLQNLVQRLRTCSISATELIQAYLAQAESLRELNAWITLNAEYALDQAAVCDRAIQQGQLLGPLHGIPLAIKDNIAVQGLPLTAGSPLNLDSTSDAPTVTQLRRAGAIILGKTHMSPWAMQANAHNRFWGDCLNPHDHTLDVGGSSSGSAVAVVTHMCAAALGSDTAGSVRIPAALSGCVGLKPTHGIWSLDGVIPLSQHVDQLGLLTRTIADCRYLFEILVPELAPARDLATLRVLVRQAAADAAATQALTAAAQTLAKHGATIETRELPWLDDARRLNGMYVRHDAWHTYHEHYLQNPEHFAPETAYLIAAATAPAPPDSQALATVQAHADALWRKYDLLLSSTVPWTNVIRSSSEYHPITKQNIIDYTAPWNVLGLPALAIPGASYQGLPTSVQLIGPANSEATLLGVAEMLEQT